MFAKYKEIFIRYVVTLFAKFFTTLDKEVNPVEVIEPVVKKERKARVKKIKV